ncbi:MAG: hypothetical protein ACOCWW_02095, partial [Bacteroidota bacterium]
MRRLSLILFIVFIFQSVAFSQSDTLTIQKSTDKVKIGGRYYYVHIVAKDETLYSLSKIYN